MNERRIRERAERTRRLIGWLQFFRMPPDEGVGDTLSRMLAKSEGKEIHRPLQRLFGSCNCRPGDAAETLNKLHPYDVSFYLPGKQ